MSQPTTNTTPAQDSGGGGGAAPAPTYTTTLLGPDGLALNPNLRRALALDGGGGAVLYVARFTDGAETFFALGAWVNPQLSRPPAKRATPTASLPATTPLTGAR